ncbi:MAG: hypothetical protein JWQ02_1484 [Capsulimonas sp.]|nr:hypothetical protein [Capsulimonas sp.]
MHMRAATRCKFFLQSSMREGRISFPPHRLTTLEKSLESLTVGDYPPFDAMADIHSFPFHRTIAQSRKSLTLL